jgi:PAS domain S-box-containing protein
MVQFVMKLVRFQDWPMRRKMLAILLVASTVPLLVTSFVAVRNALDAVRHRHYALLEAHSDDVVFKLESFHARFAQAATDLATHVKTVKAYVQASDAERPALAKNLQNPLNFFDETVGGYRDAENTGSFLALAFVKPDGTVVAEKRLTADRIDPNLPANAFFASAIHPRRPGISPLYLAREVGNRPIVAYVHPAPVDDDGKVVLLAVLWVDAHVLWNVLTEHKIVAQGGYLALYDDEGVCIGHTLGYQMLFHPAGDLAAVHPEALAHMVVGERFGANTRDLLNDPVSCPEQFRKSRKTATDQAADHADDDRVVMDREVIEDRDKAVGEPTIGLSRALTRAPWTVFYMMPLRTFQKTAWGTYWLQAVLLGVLLLTCASLALLGGMLFARAILTPVRSLARTMERFGRGQWNTRAPSGGNDELGSLAAGFNQMAGKLEATVTSLNQALAAQAASEAHLRAIMDTDADALVTITEEGLIDSCNRAATRIFGYESVEIVGRSVSMLLSAPGEVWAEGEIVRYLGIGKDASPFAPAEVEGRRKDGNIVPLELAIGRVEANSGRLYAATFHDLTRRKQAEEELRSARDAAEASNQAKSQFLANMSHELRTPLTAIIGYTEMLQEELSDREQSDLLPDVEQVYAQSKHLLALINDLLDMSKIEAGKVALYLETFELGQMLRDIATTIAPLVARNSNRFEMEAPDDLGMMQTDLTRLRQCLLNLLSNACKFTENGVVRLSVKRSTIAGSDWITFVVSDSGIGMTLEQLRKIFEAFTQADLSTTRKYGGTGLGLAITRRLCQLMGGEVRATSKRGQGSSFTMMLPAMVRKPADEPSLAPQPRDLAPVSPDGETVLVADDDPAAREMLRRVLTREGFQVVMAQGGEECLQLARKLRPRAITLDVMMTGMDGWAVLSALKADANLADIPVIMLTVVDDKNLGFSLGASDYLTKPLDRERLMATLKKHCTPASLGLALIAEDHTATRDLLRRTLEKDGWTVVEAANGREALAILKDRRPSLILLDLMMPEVDGFEFLAEVRQHPEWQSIPVVVLTAKELSEEDRLFLNGSMALSSHVKRLLQKGTFSLDDLARQVRDLARPTSVVGGP